MSNNREERKNEHKAQEKKAGNESTITHVTYPHKKKGKIASAILPKFCPLDRS
jgi:hypothetical protein